MMHSLCSSYLADMEDENLLLNIVTEPEPKKSVSTEKKSLVSGEELAQWKDL